MNKIIVFLLVITLVLSCKKDHFNTDNQLERLRIDNLLSLLPLGELNGHNKVVFTSMTGDTITLDYTITKDTKIKKVNNRTYEAEEISIAYVDQTTDDYSLYISGSGNYLEESNSNLYVSCGISQFITAYSPIITISEEGQPVLAQYFESISLANRSFYEVFTNYPVDGYDAYGQIYYNTQYGVVGFADSNGEIYALESIEE